MSAYDVALFLHLLGVVTLFAAIALVQGAGLCLRRAASAEQVRLWIGWTRSAAPLFPVALLVVVASGLFMAADSWSLSTPWIAVAIVSVIVLGGIGGIVQGMRFRTIGSAAATTENGPLPPRLRQLIAAPALWITVFTADVGTIGILWTMATKPGWIGSIAAVVGPAIVGAFAGFRAAHAAQRAARRARPVRRSPEAADAQP